MSQIVTCVLLCCSPYSSWRCKRSGIHNITVKYLKQKCEYNMVIPPHLPYSYLKTYVIVHTVKLCNKVCASLWYGIKQAVATMYYLGSTVFITSFLFPLSIFDFENNWERYIIRSKYFLSLMLCDFLCNSRSPCGLLFSTRWASCILHQFLILYMVVNDCYLYFKFYNFFLSTLNVFAQKQYVSDWPHDYKVCFILPPFTKNIIHANFITICWVTPPQVLLLWGAWYITVIYNFVE